MRSSLSGQQGRSLSTAGCPVVQSGIARIWRWRMELQTPPQRLASRWTRYPSGLGSCPCPADLTSCLGQGAELLARRGTCAKLEGQSWKTLTELTCSSWLSPNHSGKSNFPKWFWAWVSGALWPTVQKHSFIFLQHLYSSLTLCSL